MRKILYRAKSVEKDNLGEWVYGDLIHHNEEAFYILPQNREYSELYKHGILVDKNTIGQFIGIYDVSRKEIYEGDVIQFLMGTYTVKWSLSNLSFRMEQWINEEEGVKEIVSFMLTPHHEHKLTIVGNIHDDLEKK